MAFSWSTSDQTSAEQFCRDIIREFKASNIDSGITPVQAMWVHSRFRSVPVAGLTARLPNGFEITFAPGTEPIDLLNMLITADLEAGYLALDVLVPDDMTQPWHFLSPTRVNWIKDKVARFLGWL